MRVFIKIGMTVLILALLAGCVADQHDRRIVVAPEKTVSIYDNGAIFKAGFNERPLYEERRPRNVGDGLVMTVAEIPAAKKPPPKAADEEEGRSRRREHDEELSNIASDALVGNVSMSVIEVLDNGYLHISGGKQVNVDGEDKFVRVSGIVDPRNLTGGNTISSILVSDVRIMVDDVRIYSDGTAIKFSEGQNTFGNNFQSMSR